ncbi:MAG: ABC transporter ATP-binding protein [Chloroflexi bacterium]|nr:ABC transporter ATP-binding protein [Chloroflexota bacterium]MBU1747530.1 ABC transporter ATP-binding protein [Chloroflexota bacterium]MBU1877752.1 ABC transporter ATP-binding protein [Chloroflexota bacterium]
MTGNGIILETRHLRKDFQALRAVDDVSIQVRQGTFHSIIGPNGAGKTTLFNLLSGTLKPSEGEVLFKGQDITRFSDTRRSHLGIGRSFQITNIFPNLTVLENVRIATQSRGHDSLKIWMHYGRYRQYEERAREILAEVGLAGRELQIAGLLPHGDQRKLEIAILMATEPELLLLDEPTAGISREEVPAIMEVIGRIKARSDKTIMLVEHKMDIVMGTSDVITVMHLGNVIAEGTPAEIAGNETVQNAYLGGLYKDAMREALAADGREGE